ncbi:MAG TPA: DUF3300 domain-containing protein, partial [Stellaceae bacterium]|nr:DUF3300 domain-containing protein [Stellaceae bacterium]
MMKRLVIVLLAAFGMVFLAASGLSGVALAQDQAGAPPPAPQGPPAFTPQQLDQLLAPVALYPDPLLTQILAASTYPLEVVEAARWLGDPNNAQLRGDALTAALAAQDWDPSVKSLIPFPQTIQMMNKDLGWMQRVGNAFLAQQADVMDSVQRLRHQAQAAGALASTPQQTVTAAGPAIVIAPANPEIVYVPVYDPRLVYGPWAYPAYPPVYFPPPPGYFYTPVVGLGFGIGFVGVTIFRPFWGWGDFDWRRHDIHLDRDRFFAIDREREERFGRDHRDGDRGFDRDHFKGDSWQHDPYHRRAVAYRDPHTAQRFQPARGAAPATPRADFRGFANRPATAT